MGKVLIVVDYQKDFVDGALGFKDAEALEKGIISKINEYMDNSDYVICTFDTHGDNYLGTQEGIKLPVPHCIKNSDGWKLYGGVEEAAYNASAVNIEKPTFGSLDLAKELLRLNELEKKVSGRNITKIEICGVVTNMCVISNAVIAKAALPEAQISILSNLCSSFDMTKHEEALSVMESMQMEIVR